jgi:UDP-2-acetamido-2,6-beta-L-arabino-hexul-4-ose reductase
MHSVLILGAGGFIGSNIVSHFKDTFKIITLKIDDEFNVLYKAISDSDIIIHASGVSKSDEETDFFKINLESSTRLAMMLSEHQKKKIIYFSSIHFHRNDIYGFSKRYNEYLFSNGLLIENNYCLCLRTPGVFGPGSKPNYVSVVSTFCYNLVNKISSNIIDPDKIIELIFVGDILRIVESSILMPFTSGFTVLEPKSVQISVGELYSLIHKISIGENIDLKHYCNNEFIKQIILTFKYYKNNAKSKCVIG